MRKKVSPGQAFEQQLLTELPGLSVDHLGPLADLWHEAAQHPHIAGTFTPEEKAQRFAARVQTDRAAGHPYALAAVASARPPGSPTGFPPTSGPIEDRFS